MANPARGERDITIGGRRLTVAFGINAICEIEAALGEEIGVVGTRLAQGRGAVRDLRALLWGGLRRHHPAFTVGAVGDLLDRHLADGGTLEMLGDPLYQGLAAAFPATAESAEGNAPAPETTTRRAGRTSTARRSRRASTPIEPGA